MQEHGLDPLSTEGITEAAALLGAEIVITGTVDAIDLQQVSLRIGFLSFASASADVVISADSPRGGDRHHWDGRRYRSGTGIAQDRIPQLRERLRRCCDLCRTDRGRWRGAALSGFTVDIRDLLSLTTSSSTCRGGLRTDRPWYHVGETVSLGYLNPSSPGWYSLEIHSSTGAFVRWLGWKYIDTGACGRWLWDQKDSAQIQVPPAVYAAKLWDGASYVASSTFQLRPDGGISIELLGNITVGSEPFEGTVVGAAVNRAVARLATDLISGIEEAEIPLRRSEQALAPSLTGEHREGQIAAIIPDGRIAINIGAAAGVALGDRFEVIETENLLIDPETLSIISYDAVGVEGEILIVEVHDDVSYAVRVGEFTPAVGDVVRFIEP